MRNTRGSVQKSAYQSKSLHRLCVICVLIFAALVLFSVDIVSAQEIPDSLAKRLAEFKGAERGQIISVKEESLTRAFPGYSFYVLRFRQYPIALAPPEPLGSNNLFIVKPDGSVEYLRESETLKTFFRAALPPVTTQAQARDAAKAWLRLAQEFHQDGFFRFLVPEDSIRVGALEKGGLEVSGQAVVNQQGGNMGELGASLTFDPAGVLTKVSESAQIHRGIRPRCQATKLLDPDPIVRRMAEEAIIVMGKAAALYLYEQRAKTSPELQHAIDAIWRRIIAEGR